MILVHSITHLLHSGQRELHYWATSQLLPDPMPSQKLLALDGTVFAVCGAISNGFSCSLQPNLLTWYRIRRPTWLQAGLLMRKSNRHSLPGLCWFPGWRSQDWRDNNRFFKGLRFSSSWSADYKTCALGSGFQDCRMGTVLLTSFAERFGCRLYEEVRMTSGVPQRSSMGPVNGIWRNTWASCKSFRRWLYNIQENHGWQRHWKVRQTDQDRLWNWAVENEIKVNPG
jgi:hypothetical protein